MAEDLADFLREANVKVHYLHSEVDTLERIEILRDLRLGVFDVLVGINLLREGLDLPEVSLVAILDADKEGFLRSETSLIQTIGRAARNVSGKVIMYADAVTGSMERALAETSRRRALQMAYNQEHGIEPETVKKAVREVLQAHRVADKKEAYSPDSVDETHPVEDIMRAIQELEVEMRQRSKSLEFEEAALLRDEIQRLKRLLPDAEFAESVAPSMPTYMAKRASRGTAPKPKDPGASTRRRR
jgi:excinuclease ABC subunit B